jgi:hypothetical protein
LQAQQALVLRVDIEKQAVTHLQVVAQCRAACQKPEDRVSAVGMVIDQKRVWPHGTWHAGTEDLQSRQGIGFDFRPSRPQFAPSDRTVGIGIEADGKVQIAQGNIPLPRHGAFVDGQ